MKRPPAPPAVPRWILERVLPPDARSEAVLGDLHEEFLLRAVRSPARARLLYWWDALTACVHLALEHARRQRRVRHRQPSHERLMDQLRMNVRYALRRFMRAPFFTLVAVVSLALGIGANTAMFSVVNAVILRKPPFQDPERLVDIYLRSEGFSHGTLSYPDYEDVIKGTSGVFSDVLGSLVTFVQTDTEGGVDVLTAETVTGDYFDGLGLHPAVGRLLGDEDDVAPGAHPVVVLSYGYWQRRFAGSADAVGAQLRLGGRPYTVVGVAPEAYSGSLRGIAPDVYVPIMMHDELMASGSSVLKDRGSRSLFTKGRLAPGATMAQAEAVMERLATDLRKRYPLDWQSGDRFVLVPTVDVILNPMVDRVLVPAAGLIMTVVGLVLLIACANLASFLLARAADRRREIAVRLALGAKRRTLVVQLLTETVIIAVVGGLAGVALAVVSLRALTSADLPLPLPITLDLSLDGKVLAFSGLVSLAAGLLFGMAPALQRTRTDVAPTLRDESAGGGRARGAALRSMLVAGQVAVSMVLLVGAGLFLRSLDAARNVDPGFGYQPTGVLDLVVQADRYDEDEGRLFVRSLRERIEELPGVQAVGLTDNIHLNPLNTQYARVMVDGVDPPPGREFHEVDRATVDGAYFDAAGIPILAGRTFDREDNAEGDRVVVVNETFARRFFPSGSAVGRSFRYNDEDVRVVGVARDTKIRQLGEAPRPFIYLSYEQTYSSFVTFLARTTGDADETALAMLETARKMDPEIMVVKTTTLERHLASLLVGRRLGALVVSGFALLALLLASIGLYGVVSYAVARRAREVGIRMSLGAEAGKVVWLLTGAGMKLVLTGGVVGLGLSAVLAQLLSRLLYGVPALDPLTFTLVPAVLLTVALLAAWVPARRASRVDPVRALRTD